MKTVMNTHYLESRFGIEKTIQLIADAGFDGIDYTDMRSETFLIDDYQKRAKVLREQAENSGLKFYQTHAPVPSSLLKQGDMDYVKARTIHSLEVASLLGAEAVVVHPIQDSMHKLGDDSVYEKNMDYFRTLLPYCEKYNVKIAIENMTKVDPKTGVKRDGVCAHPLEFKKYLNDLNSLYATGCFDIGHCAATGREPQDVLRILGGNRITCLHVHDNDYMADKHMLPCTMDLNWEEICKALAEIQYSGHLTLEADCFLPKYSDDFIPVALRFMHDTASYLVNKIEKYCENLKFT